MSDAKLPSPVSTSPTIPRSPSSDHTAGEVSDSSRAAARQRKRRELLKQYYGIGEAAGAPVPHEAIKKKESPDPRDIDNYAFNAELHLNKMMNEMALPDLIQRDNELVAEIKQLDGDMKTLVYENYSKFISATDTIRRMKTNVEDMECEMDLLTKSMANIEQSSTAINQDLAEQRTKLHQLTSVDNLLKKLHFVFELPNRLRECVDKGQHQQAVRYYSRVSNLLERYRHMSVFKEIEEECRVILDKLSRLLEKKLKDDATVLPETSETVGLMIILNAMSPIDLAREHLKAACAQLKRLKQNCLNHMNTMKGTDSRSASELSGEPLPADVQLAMEKITYFDSTFVQEFANFVEAYYGCFMPPKDSSMRDDISKSNVSEKLSPEQQTEVRTNFVSMVDAITKEYVEVVEGLLHIPDDITQLSPLAYIYVLDRVHKDVQGMETLKRVGRIDKRVNAMSFELLSKVVTAVFAKIKKEFFNRYKDVKPSSDLDLARFVKDLNVWMRNTLINQYLPILERFISPDIDFMKHSIFGTDDILDQIQRGLDVFWLSFAEDITAFNEPPTGSTHALPSPLVTLMMSRSALELSQGTVEGVMSAYTDVLFSRKGDHAAEAQMSTQSRRPQLTVVTASGGTVAGTAGAGMGSRSGTRSNVSGTSHETMIRAREISGICKNTAQRLLTLYVERLTREMTMLLQDYTQTADWVKMAEPTTASPAWIQILDKMATVDRDVGQLYQDDGSLRDRGTRTMDPTRANTKQHGGHSRSGSSSQPHMQTSSSTGSFKSAGGHVKATSKFDPLLSHIDKLFAERVEYYGTVEMTKGAVLTAIAKIIAKALVEEVRLLTLGNGGFRQIQIDIEMLKVHLSDHCSDPRFLDVLLEEAQTCVYRRCVNPTLLDYRAIEPIVSSYGQG